MRHARPASNRIFSKAHSQEDIDLVALMAAPLPKKPLRTTAELLLALATDECCCGAAVYNNRIFCGDCRLRLERANMVHDLRIAEAEIRMAQSGSDVPPLTFQKCADFLSRSR